MNLYTAADFGNARGVDVRLDRRFGSIFQGTLSYSYETAKNTGSDPHQYLNTLARTNSAVTGARVPPPQAILTSTDNRTHTIAGNLAANFPAGWHSGTLLGSILENGGIYATFRAASGLAYTLMENGGLGARGPGNGFGLSAAPLEPINSSDDAVDQERGPSADAGLPRGRQGPVGVRGLPQPVQLQEPHQRSSPRPATW